MKALQTGYENLRKIRSEEHAKNKKNVVSFERRKQKAKERGREKFKKARGID